ncbi:MAG: putative cytokinetic ring protein SteA [Capsulimonadaceae bacterium]
MNLPITQAAGTLQDGTIQAVARVDRRTKNLLKRLRPGEIAVIDHVDLDALAARGLADGKAAAVVNVQPFVSGRYPNRGPHVLLAAGIPLYQLVPTGAIDKLRDGERVTLSPGGLRSRDGKIVGALECWDEERTRSETTAARANLGSELERFARNTLQYIESEMYLLLDPTDVPPAGKLKIAGRHALIVVRGESYREDLQLLRSYIHDVRPVLIAVDGGADALLGMGHRPDIIIGDMDSVSDAALRCGARIIVHAYAGTGDAPGLQRMQQLGLRSETFPVPGTSEDAALLFAYEHHADIIVAVGTHSNLEDFLDKGRSGMASTFLVRLKVGNRLVDARGVYKLYRPTAPVMGIVAIVCSAMFPIFLVVSDSPLWRNLGEMARIWLKLHIPWLGHHHHR